MQPETKRHGALQRITAWPLDKKLWKHIIHTKTPFPQNSCNSCITYTKSIMPDHSYWNVIVTSLMSTKSKQKGATLNDPM